MNTQRKLENKYINSENFEKDFIYFEDLEKNPELFKKIIEKDLKEIQEGNGTPIEEFIKEIEEKYNFIEITNDDNKNFTDYELEFPPEVYEKIEKGLQDVKEGRCRPIEEFIAEMEEKYHINE